MQGTGASGLDPPSSRRQPTTWPPGEARICNSSNVSFPLPRPRPFLPSQASASRSLQSVTGTTNARSAAGAWRSWTTSGGAGHRCEGRKTKLASAVAGGNPTTSRPRRRRRDWVCRSLQQRPAPYRAGTGHLHRDIPCHRVAYLDRDRPVGHSQAEVAGDHRGRPAPLQSSSAPDQLGREVEADSQSR